MAMSPKRTIVKFTWRGKTVVLAASGRIESQSQVLCLILLRSAVRIGIFENGGLKADS